MSIDVGERLRFVRARNKISQRELAKRSGVTNSTISLIESNQMNPSVGALKRILDGIPMGMAEFFALEPDRPRKAFYRSDELSEIGKGSTFVLRLPATSGIHAATLLSSAPTLEGITAS